MSEGTYSKNLSAERKVSLETSPWDLWMQTNADELDIQKRQRIGRIQSESVLLGGKRWRQRDVRCSGSSDVLTQAYSET